VFNWKKTFFLFEFSHLVLLLDIQIVLGQGILPQIITLLNPLAY